MLTLEKTLVNLIENLRYRWDDDIKKGFIASAYYACQLAYYKNLDNWNLQLYIIYNKVSRELYRIDETESGAKLAVKRCNSNKVVYRRVPLWLLCHTRIYNNSFFVFDKNGRWMW